MHESGAGKYSSLRSTDDLKSAVELDTTYLPHSCSYYRLIIATYVVGELPVFL